MRKIIIPIIVVVFIGIVLFKWYIGGYNKVVTLDENVKSSWAQVDNQLKRRYDLIPNLVETVKGYATHEKETFEGIANSRKAYMGATTIKGKMDASRGLESFLGRLLAIREAYPDLKANQSFLKLQDSLEGSENRIAVERMRYNESVRTLNTYIKKFFGRFFAGRVGVEKAEYFETPEKETAVPKVKF
jgi:LemA protein